MRQILNREWHRPTEWTRLLAAFGRLATLVLLAGLAASEALAQTARPGQPALQLPKFPQQFNVQGPEVHSLVFAVTQPGPVVVDVQAQGAPIVVTLQSPGGQPTTNRGTGTVRLNYNVTPQDVKRGLFWTAQVRAWCEEDCRAAGRRPQSSGSVMVQHPPIDQAVVQQAMRALAARQQAPAPQSEKQANVQAAAQMDQAFQQRKAQFEQLQLQRRAALFSRVQPQLDQLHSRMGINPAIKSRGLEATDARATAQMQRPMQPGMRVQPGQANAQAPAFPQRFQLLGPETASFGFGVTQPGPVQVDVDAQGMPVVVTLQSLGAAPISQQGSGRIRVTHQVTPQDVQRSALWVARVSLAQGGVPGQASGTVMVQHPAADPAVVQAQSAALKERERAEEQRFAAEVTAKSRAEFQEFKARFERQHLQRQAAERAQIQPIIDQLRAKSPSLVRTRGVDTPVIDRLNKSQGQPKDQLILYGRNFGGGGEVVFQLAPNVRGTGVVEAWSDTVVVVDVPDASGLLQFDGTVLVATGPAQSNALPFRFVPLQEVREIRSTRGDISIAQPGTAHTSPTATNDRIDHDNTTFMQLGGSKGNDIFFPTSRLQNGWLVHEIKPSSQGCGTPFCTGVTLADSRIGSDVPFFSVRWWYDALANLKYSFSMRVVGPRGVPDGILVTGPLNPVVPPGTPAPSPAPAPETPVMTTVLLPPVAVATGSTPPTQPPPSQPATGTPPQMTVVPLNPALLPVTVAAPGFGTQGTGNPTITSLSVTQGQPGDPVMITGTGFGAGSGEIHFVIAPGKDLTPPAGATWSDTQIFTSVPDATGLLGFNGQVYVKRATDQKVSNLVSFRFEPALELRMVNSTQDMRIGSPGSWQSGLQRVEHKNSESPFWGFKGNDEFFMNARLQNGWILDEVFLTIVRQDRGGAYIAEKRGGTNWPYFNVRFWVDAAFGAVRYNGSVVDYVYAVSLRGPKGVPDGLVCTQLPCP